MMYFLDWQINDNYAVTSPQIITYRDADNNVTILPLIQFVATAEFLGQEWYPVILAFDSNSRCVWKTSYRANEDAFTFAIEQIESAFSGQDMLNMWAYEILENLQIAS